MIGLTQHQINTMVRLQTEANVKVDPNWIFNRNDWLLAGGMELMEAIDHHGWKWWKAHEIDLPQLQIELVDYWHFALSHSIEDDPSNPDHFISKSLFGKDSHDEYFEFDDQGYIIAELSTVKKLKLLAGLAFANRFNYHLFESILSDCNLNWYGLYRLYVGKNVLNNFRQDNGYKNGSYIKRWKDGREDNEHMFEFLEFLDCDDHGFDEAIYNQLEIRYKEAVAYHSTKS